MQYKNIFILVFPLLFYAIFTYKVKNQDNFIHIITFRLS